MDQTEKARRFAELHVKGPPLVLFNAWDAGSAKFIVAAGAKAIATSSWSVAKAQGYPDGEAIPIKLAEQIVARIAADGPFPRPGPRPRTVCRRSSGQGEGLRGRRRVRFLHSRVGKRCAHRPNLRERHAARQRHGNERRTIE
jgi:hypothetical protein